MKNCSEKNKYCGKQTCVGKQHNYLETQDSCACFQQVLSYSASNK